MSGQNKEIIKQRGWGTEEGRSSKGVKGSQTGENGRSVTISDRESISGKVPRDTLFFAIMGVDGVKDRSYTGEKSKSTTLLEDVRMEGGNDQGVNTHVGREISPGETLRRLGLEVEEGIGARAGRGEDFGADNPGKSVGSTLASSGRVQMYPSMVQEQKELGSGQADGTTSGSGSTSGPGIELGRTQDSITGLDHDGASQSPSYSNRPIPDGLNVSSFKCFKAKVAGEKSGLKQGLVLRPSMHPERKRASFRDSNCDAPDPAPDGDVRRGCHPS